MDKFTEFVMGHEGEEVEALVLQKGRWPDIDVALAADTIAGRRKMRVKAPSWWECAEVVYPSRLCVEQCSSEAVCEIKAEIISAMLSGREADGKGSNYSVSETVNNEKKIGAGEGHCNYLKLRGLMVADLTGGLGVDSWMFSKMAERVLYVERDSKLAETAKHNFSVLGCKNIEVVNAEVSPEGFSNDGWEVLRKFAPDIIYLDPARRGEGGEKVFKLEDCRPNILELRDKLLETAELVVVKLSPMADIDEVVRQLGPCCRWVEVISVDGECKEVLAIMERGFNGGGLIGVNCGKQGSFAFFRSDEATAVPRYLSPENLASLTGKILLEPDKAVMKAGPFKLLSEMFGLMKLDVSTHYYIDGCAKNSEGRDIYGSSAFEEYGKTCERDVYAGNEKISGETKDDGGSVWDDEIDRAEKISGLFRQFRILRVEPLNKKTLLAVGQDYPNAEVTARNIPLTTDELRKRLRVNPSDKIHIFGLRSGGENLLFVTEKL